MLNQGLYQSRTDSKPTENSGWDNFLGNNFYTQKTLVEMVPSRRKICTPKSKKARIPFLISLPFFHSPPKKFFQHCWSWLLYLPASKMAQTQLVRITLWDTNPMRSTPSSIHTSTQKSHYSHTHTQTDFFLNLSLTAQSYAACMVVELAFWQCRVF